MKTEIKIRRGAGARLLRDLFNGTVVNNATVVRRNGGANSAIFQYEVEVEVEPTVEELFDELKVIIDRGGRFDSFTMEGDYLKVDNLVNEIRKLVLDRPSDNR